MLAEVGPTTVLPSPPSYSELVRLCASGDFDVVVTQLIDRMDKPLLQRARIRGISNYAVGYDNIDVAAAARRGITVANTPGVLTDPTADLAMLLILATARRCIEGDHLMRVGEFTGWEPHLLLGADVSGRSLGLIGWGRIAQAVARRALGFGMDVRFVTVHDGNRPRGHDELGVGSGVVRQMGLDELLETSHFVSLHVPLSRETRHLIDRSALDAMRSDAILINTARGSIVDEAALVEALRNGSIAAAGLDVYEREPDVAPGLSDLANTVLLPHLGSATQSVRAQMSRLAAANALAMSCGTAPPHEVRAARDLR